MINKDVKEFIKNLKERWEQKCNRMGVMSSNVAILELDFVIGNILQEIQSPQGKTKTEKSVSDVVAPPDGTKPADARKGKEKVGK
jgi:hypothetical protein